MNFSAETKKSIFSAASEAFLMEPLPLDFHDLDEGKQNSLLTELASSSHENDEPDYLLEVIDSYATLLEQRLAEHVGGEEVKANDRFFLVNLNTRHGEYEESRKDLISSENEKSAIKYAFELNARDKLEYPEGEDGYALDCHGEIAISLQSAVEVSQFEAAILRKYL